MCTMLAQVSNVACTAQWAMMQGWQPGIGANTNEDGAVRWRVERPPVEAGEKLRQRRSNTNMTRTIVDCLFRLCRPYLPTSECVCERMNKRERERGSCVASYTIALK